MQLLELPTEILAMVLRQSLTDRDYGWWFERNLLLVTICRRLRYIALPIVYREVRVDAFEAGSTGRRRYNVNWSRSEPGFGIPISLGAHGRWGAISNADFIASMGYTGLVKHMRIDVEAGHGHVVGLGLAVRYLCNAASEWPAAKRLEISVKEPTVDSSFRPNDVGFVHANAFAELALALRDMVPNAWVLRFVDARRLLAPAFGEQLSQHYHQQLRILHFDGRTDMPPTNSFPQVRDLYFAGTYLLPDHIPQVDAAKLERLRLHRVDPLHSWAAFGADNSSGMIKFSALTSFSVDYVPVNNIGRAPVARDRRSVKLGFPLLRSARIECPSGLCPMLAGAVFPCLMESLDIRISAPVWRSISHMELPVATRLKLAILSSVGDDTRLPLSFNQLLTNSHQCGDATLRADFHEPSAYLPRIALTGLTGLVVGVPISADMLLDIIGKLPRLVTLVALRSKRDPIQADIAIPGPSECHPVEPLDAKLQTLSYGQRDAHELSDADVVIYQYLLLKLPSLQWFGTRSKLTEKLAPFVEAYQEWYPHLAGVDFCRIDYQRF